MPSNKKKKKKIKANLKNHPNDHHYVVTLARISLTLSLAIRLYRPSLPVGLLYILYPCRAMVDEFYRVV